MLATWIFRIHDDKLELDLVAFSMIENDCLTNKHCYFQNIMSKHIHFTLVVSKDVKIRYDEKWQLVIK